MDEEKYTISSRSTAKTCSHRLRRRQTISTHILCCVLLICTLLKSSCFGLAPISPSILSTRSTTLYTSPKRKQSTRLYNSFNMNKPTFDLLSFRPIRSDALMRYNSLNQSEPLRINLYLLGTITLLLYPLWSESVTGDVPTTIPIIGSITLGIGSGFLFNRERTRRSNQLYRMEKELNAENLQVKVPVNTSIMSSRPTARLADLKSKRRIVAIRGNKQQLSKVWDDLCVLRRRLVQSQTLVVLVPTDSSKKEDWGCNKNQIGDALWLAEPLTVEGEGGWINYFSELLDNSDGSNSKSNELAWFALNFKGRSIASGLGEIPRVIELMGQQLLPMELLDDTDEAEIPVDVPEAKDILECQKKFYSVLTSSSDANDMKPVFSTSQAEEVNEVINGGGRIDGWDKCLEPDARPAGMKIASSDVYLANELIAYSTCVEFPSNAGIDGATLLAIQRWGRETETDDWKLELHQTIPWSVGSRAGGTLRCDCRGCVALARGQEKRTFGGLIG